jgi:hypothetical protein
VLDSFRELIDELLSTPSALRELGVADSADDQVRMALALLTERDATLLDQIQQATRTNDPVFPAPKETPSDESLVGETAALLDRFDTIRGELVSLLMNLTLKDWERTAIDGRGRSITVADNVETHVEFDEAMRDRFDELLG